MKPVIKIIIPLGLSSNELFRTSLGIVVDDLLKRHGYENPVCVKVYEASTNVEVVHTGNPFYVRETPVNESEKFVPSAKRAAEAFHIPFLPSKGKKKDLPGFD